MSRQTTQARQRTNSSQQRGGQMAKRERGIGWLQGSFREPAAVNERLAGAAQKANLVAPATAIGRLPEGTAVALNVVTLDDRDMKDGGEVYSPGGGRYALGRSVLNRIAAAAGVSWDAAQSGRLDDGSDPNYCHFRAVGWYKSFDGTELQISGEKEMDLRDKSPQIDSMLDRSRSGDITKQLRELRLHILAHAESKAKNRAIRSLGLKPTYSREELKKPFVAAKIVWTGETDDPELKRVFAKGTMQRFLGSSRAMYGAAPAGTPVAPARRQLKSPPPVGAVGAEPDDYWADAPTPSASDEGCIDAPVSSRPSGNGRPAPSGSSFTIPGGKEKGYSLHEASDGTLEWWRNKIAGDLDAGKTKPQFREKDEALLDAMEAELARRQGVPEVSDDELPPGAVHPDDEPDFGDDPEMY